MEIFHHQRGKARTQKPVELQINQTVVKCATDAPAEAISSCSCLRLAAPLGWQERCFSSMTPPEEFPLSIRKKKKEKGKAYLANLLQRSKLKVLRGRICIFYSSRESKDAAAVSEF